MGGEGREREGEGRGMRGEEEEGREVEVVSTDQVHIS